MKMVKKYFVFMICVVVSLFLVVCGLKESSSVKLSLKGVEFVVWEDKEKSIGIIDVVVVFEKEYDVKVKVVEKLYVK